MAWNTPDVYYNPEHFGLTQVAFLDLTMYDYSFDYFIVWQHEDGRIFSAYDSGCSCPSPFEEYTSLDKLTEHASFHEAAELAREMVENVRGQKWNDGKDYIETMESTYADLVAALSTR